MRFKQFTSYVLTKKINGLNLVKIIKTLSILHFKNLEYLLNSILIDILI